jgi:DNA-binding response OmpR family regulator
MAAEKTRILIVEDEEDILMETKEILEKRGYSVFTALNSDAALPIMQQAKPQVYILDVHMPKSKLDGIRILEEIRKADTRAYCIMLSRIDEADKVESAKRLGANRYVLKPIEIPSLLELIEEGVKTLA